MRRVTRPTRFRGTAVRLRLLIWNLCGGNGEVSSRVAAAGVVLVNRARRHHSGTAAPREALYFGAETETNDTELWKTDGTSTGTVLVEDLSPDQGGSYPEAIGGVLGTAIFSVDVPKKAASPHAQPARARR